jgi:hypothetical protein
MLPKKPGLTISLPSIDSVRGFIKPLSDVRALMLPPMAPAQQMIISKTQIGIFYDLLLAYFGCKDLCQIYAKLKASKFSKIFLHEDLGINHDTYNSSWYCVFFMGT